MNTNQRKTIGHITVTYPALLALASHLLIGAANAQTHTVLKNLAGSDGENPYARLTLSGSTLYGTTLEGGSSGAGTVFKVNTDGSGYTVLKNLAPPTYNPSIGNATNSDGALPFGGLTLSGNTLYGTTQGGGSEGNGVVFKVNTDGTAFTVLKNFTYFTSNDGHSPRGDLVLSGSTIYGTTSQGGNFSGGIVFKLNTDGTGYTVLREFGDDHRSNPSSLTLSGSTLYGTASGGISDYGIVFRLNTDGTGFSVLKSFDSSEGTNPDAGVTLSGGTLYGTTSGGGSSYFGTVFKLNADGTAFEVLKHFTGGDGQYPHARLTLSGSVLCGTTDNGGSSNAGTVFQLNADGTGFTVLKHFSGSDGALPYAGLTLSGGILYGTTSGGGTFGSGTVFKLELPIHLAIERDGSGGLFIRFTGAPDVTYRLQRAPSLTGPWITSAPQTAPASGLVEFHDLFPPADHAFYRVVQPEPKKGTNP